MTYEFSIKKLINKNFKYDNFSSFEICAFYFFFLKRESKRGRYLSIDLLIRILLYIVQVFKSVSQ